MHGDVFVWGKLCAANKAHRLFQSGMRADASTKEKNGQLYDAFFEVQSTYWKSKGPIQFIATESAVVHLLKS